MDVHSPTILIVTGRPAAGKTTLANWLSKELKIPLLSKDGIREALFNRLGWKDREWAQLLGKASVDMMFYFAKVQLEVGHSVILDNSFDPAVSDERFRTLKGIYRAKSIQVVCDARNEILFERFKSRFELSVRHPGHGDETVLNGLSEFLADGYSPFLDIGGPVVDVDTSDFTHVNYQETLEQIRFFLST